MKLPITHIRQRFVGQKENFNICPANLGDSISFEHYEERKTNEVIMGQLERLNMCTNCMAKMRLRDSLLKDA